VNAAEGNRPDATDFNRYRERGMFDFAPTPEIPYPEVVSYEENRDGTVKPTVNAVWPEECRQNGRNITNKQEDFPNQKAG